MQCPRWVKAIATLTFASLCTVPWSARTYGQATQPLNVDTFSHSTSAHQVSDLFFLDADHGWMAMTDRNSGVGYILKTQDGGNTWQRFKILSNINQLFFIDQKKGWALRHPPHSDSSQTRIDLVVTNDGGEHWKNVSPTPVFTPTNQSKETVTSMAFIDELHGWLVGEGPDRDGLVFQTDDGGQTLRQSDPLPKGTSNCLGVYAGPKTGVLVFGVGFVIRSVDNGKTWKSPIETEKLGINRGAFVIPSARFMHDGRGWLVGQAGGGAILSSRDFGQTWRMEFEDKNGTIFQDLWPADTKHRCAVGNSTLLFCTTNDGLTWTSRDVLPQPSTGQSRIFRNIVLLNSGRGWVLRYGGYLYRTIDNGQTWQEFDPIAQ